MSDAPPQQAEPPRQLDSGELALVLQRLRSEQNLALGAAAGAAAALIGAGAWAAITVFTRYQIGWMAVGVGFLVGLAVRTFGKGIDKTFGFAGAGLALLGCLLGNLLAVCGMIAQEEQVGILEVLSRFEARGVLDLMVATFSPMDLLFYAIAVYEGYKLSFRQVSPEEMTQRVTTR